MFSLRNLQLVVSFASVMILISIANAAAKTVPTRVAQMSAAVCWETCAGSCDKAFEKCALDNPGQFKQCATARDTCHDQCSDQCGFKK